MKSYFIERTDDTPRLNFDPKANIFQIVGKSMPDNPVKFYQPAFDWLNKFAEMVNEKYNIRLEVRFDYFNTASSKIFLDLLDEFQKFIESGATVVVEWHSRKGDDDMQEAGQEYSELVEIPFEFKVN